MSISAPVIAILGAIDDEKTATLQGTYTSAIEKSGGIPIIIPYTENEKVLNRYIEICNGVLFTGGCDIEPRIFGEYTRDTCGKIQVFRDTLELAFFKRAFALKRPIMGICRGIQLINVALGGTLYQDIPTECPSEFLHQQSEPKALPSHDVKIISGTPLMELTGKDILAANSFHHQAIKALGDGLQVMACTHDGIIEAIYYNGDGYIRGYQWHPELLYTSDDDNKALFDNFIDYCKKV